MKEPLLCGFRHGGLGRKLSNLQPYAFTFRELRYASFEGFLQSLKFQDPNVASEIALLSGIEAWKTGQSGNGWRSSQTLWLFGSPINRQSPGYQTLLEKAYDALFLQSNEFQVALKASIGQPLAHDGHHDTSLTVLTVSEYLGHLYRLRSEFEHY